MSALSPERARDLLLTVSLGLLRVGGFPSLFAVDTDWHAQWDYNQVILNFNLEDLPDDQKALIEQAVKEFREKCLMSYSKTRDSVVQKTLLLRVLLHGRNDPNEEVEARIVAQMVHKTVHEAFTNHNQVLANTIGNVIKEVFF